MMMTGDTKKTRETEKGKLVQTKGGRAELLEDCLKQRQNGHRCLTRQRDQEFRVDVTGGGDGAVTKLNDKSQKKIRII